MPEKKSQTVSPSPCRCRVCRRVLRNPKSIERQCGPICYEHPVEQKQKTMFDLMTGEVKS